MSTSSTSTSSKKHRGLASALVLGLLASLIASSGFASGGSGGGPGAPNVGSPQQREVDESYEYGKAVYLGRLPDSEKVKYCVLVEGEAKKLKKRTLKPYRRKTLKELANALYRCDDSSKLALKSLKREQVAFVLYYLNKRFRLKLSDA